MKVYIRVLLLNASHSHSRVTINFLTKPDLFILQANSRYDLATKIALVAVGLTSLACLAPAFVSGNTYADRFQVLIYDSWHGNTDDVTRDSDQDNLVRLFQDTATS